MCLICLGSYVKTYTSTILDISCEWYCACVIIYVFMTYMLILFWLVYPQVALPITDLWNVKEVQYLTRLHSIILAFERSAIKMAMRLQYFNLMYVFPVYTVPGSLQNTDKYSSTSGIEAVCYWMGNDLRNMHAGFLWSHSAADNVKSYARCKCLASYYKDTYKLCSENISAPCNTHTHTHNVIVNIHRNYRGITKHFKLTQTCSHL